MIFRRFATRKIAEVAEEIAEPIKQNITTAKNSTNMFVNVLKFFICLGCGYLLMHDNSENTPQKSETPNIVINNYIHEKE